MMNGEYKLIQYSGYKGDEPSFELYNILVDPEERKDLSTSNHSVSAELKLRLERKLTEVNQGFEELVILLRRFLPS